IEDLRRVLETGKPFEKDVQDRAGNWLLLRVLPYKSRSTLEGVVLTLIDVSTLKRTEAQLEQMSAIVASSDDAIVGMDLESQITTWNKGAEQLYGYAAEEAVGRQGSMLQPEGEGISYANLMQDMLGARSEELRDHHIETVARRRDGSTFDVLVSFSPIHDSGGELCGVSMIARDISSRKAAERELTRRAEELANANLQLCEAEAFARDSVEKRDHFLAMLSHELRNPLAAVLNAANLLQWDNIDKDSMEAARGAIARQSQHMARLLDDLLDVSRITRGRIEIRRSYIDLAQTTRDALEAVKPTLDASGLQLEAHLPDEPLTVCGDPARLQQVQVNLLNNAIKYTPEGGKLWLSVAAEGDQAVVRLRDTGLGIPAEMRDRIFDLFVQVDSTPGKQDGGMGVGLTLVRTLMHLHDGGVEVHSAGEGQGSEFIVRLPLHQGSVPAGPASNERADLVGLRVVLVEDHADIRMVTGRLLKAVGCEVHHAEDGTQGITAIAEKRPDVALIDIGLPDMNGYEVARRVRGMPEAQGVRLLAVTGFGQPEDRQKALEAGFDDHLVKPLQYETLVSMIRGSLPSCDGHGGELAV
ncbi:MAG TPA: PAS domain S-box protein, partial [Lacipirellula sp.]